MKFGQLIIREFIKIIATF